MILALEKVLNVFVSIGLGQAYAADHSLHGYLRYSTVWTPQAQWGQCLFLSDIPSNFSRLGNECFYYGELSPQIKNSQWSFVTRFSFGGPGWHPWENDDSDGREIQLTELFVTGQMSSKVSLWAGRRFYRDPDIHIADWFYFGDMIGQGLGLDVQASERWHWQIAHLIRTQSFSPSLNPQLHILDWRWIYFTSDGFWRGLLNLGFIPSYDWQGQTHGPQKGFSLGIKRRWQFSSHFHEVAFLAGFGILETLNMWHNFQVHADWDTLRQSHNRQRLIYHFGYQKAQIGWMSLLAGERVSKPSLAQDFQWFGVSIRLWYHANHHNQWVTETGYIRKFLKQPEQREDWLIRLTLGYQWSLDAGLWSRPQMRILLTHHGKKEDRAWTQDTHLTYQMEIWF